MKILDLEILQTFLFEPKDFQAVAFAEQYFSFADTPFLEYSYCVQQKVLYFIFNIKSKTMYIQTHSLRPIRIL